MARPGRPERNRAARSFGQLRRFHHGINSDKAFGTHRMTAGRGVIHNENPLPGTTARALQLGVILPASEKMAAPRYQDLRGADLPTRREPGVEIRFLSGSSGGVSSPTLNHVPVTAIAARGDVAALDCAANLFDIAEREFGPVDVFVNNAGMLRQAPLAESDDAMFDRLVEGVFQWQSLG